jgi:ectoine hydroxylase-related dioxygenase (phytanoyl-CoA dioxygenase family)
MHAGSAIVFDGALWHRGGANHTQRTRLAISPQYCQPWLRPQESQLLIAPPERARSASSRVRAMLGYSIHPPFIGQVDGMHPLRLVDAAYRAHKGVDRVIADRVLDSPQASMIVDDPASASATPGAHGDDHDHGPPAGWRGRSV